MLYPDEENDAEGVGDEYGGYEDEYDEGSDYYSYEEGPKVDNLEGEPPFQSKSLPGVTGHDLTDIKAILNEFAILSVSPKVRTYQKKFQPAPLPSKFKRKMPLFQSYTSDDWTSACSALWWPFEDNICHEMRCLTCYPAVIAAHTNCKTKSVLKTHSCVQKVS